VSAAFKGRREDARLLTGQGRFTADVNLPGQLYAHFVRSDRAHARIISIDVSPARKSAGTRAIFTGDDVAHFRTPPPMVKYPIKVPHRDILARGRVRYVGQEVALVVATSASAAQDAAESIVIEYEDLPAVTDAARASESGAPQLHDEAPENLAAVFQYGDEAAASQAFQKAAHVTRIALEANRISGVPMEPKACVAAYDAASDVYELYAPSQGMSMMLPVLSAITGVAADNIRLYAADVGGGFGVRSEAYAEYPVLMHAAKALGRPVKWVGSRFESLVSDHHGRAAQLEGELALDRDGGFLGLRVRWLVNTGAYLSHPGPLINSINPSTHAINAYRIPALFGRHALVFTNTTSTTAYRGAGRPNVSYLVERLVDEAARETGIDRIELRRRNLIPKDAFPYRTPTGSTYDSGDPAGQLDKAVRFSDWNGFAERKKNSNRLRGIGLAMFIEPSGGGGSPHEQAAIKFGASGEPTLYSLAGASGQGHETMFSDIVAEVLGIPAEDITVRSSDTSGPRLAGGGTVGSRSMMAHGGALFATAQEVVKKALDLAAKDMEVSPADIEFRQGKFRVKGTDLSMTFQEVARRYARQLDTQGAIPTPVAFPGGAHVAEVEIDPDTGVVELARYVAVDDCGLVLNHVLVEGQVHGGIVQGLGQALCEHVRYDESGQVLTGSFMDYAMPRADLLPGVELHDHSIPSPSNPLGVKGAGEAGTTGSVPALANAVIDALRPLGIHHLDFPYSPDRVWQAIARAKPA
jgi:aerobic carbon-monoxide dehydrogenase large subunit